MKFRKLAAAISAVAMLGSLAVAVPANADDGTWSNDGYTYTTGAKYDTTIRYGNNNNTWYTSKTIELKYNSDYFVGACSFAIPSTPVGKVIDSVSLRLVTERKKNSSNVSLYKLNKSIYTKDNITFAEIYSDITGVSDAVTAVEGTDKITEFEVNGTNQSIYYDSINNSNYKNLSAWTNNITIDKSYVTPEEDFAILMSSNGQANETTQFFTKEVDITASDSNVTSNTSKDVTSDDLKPQLTITYADDPDAAGKAAYVKSTKAYYDRFSDAVIASDSDDTITLLDNITETGLSSVILPNKNLTIVGNNKILTINKNLEIASGKGTLTVTDLTVSGDGAIDVKGNSTIYADNLTANVNIGGYYGNSKGTIANSTIGTLNSYGHITLNNTDVDTVVIPNISDSADQPKIIADSTSTISSVTLTKVSKLPNTPYELFSGDVIPANNVVTVPSGYSYDDGYVYASTTKYFDFALEAGVSYDTATITIEGIGNRSKTVSNITGGGQFTCGITGIPEGTVITGMILEGTRIAN